MAWCMHVFIFCVHYVRRISIDDDYVDPVLEVALHLSKQDEQPPPSDEPKYV